MKQLAAGIYLGSNSYTYKGNGVYLTIINYTQQQLLDSSLHSHANPHVTLFLQGGTLEKRRGVEYERKAGQVAFFHSGEMHQNLSTRLPSKNINLEFEQKFLNEYHLQDTDIQKAIGENLNTTFLPLKVYHEVQVNDSFSYESIIMLLLGTLEEHPRYRKTPPLFIIKVEQILQDRWNHSITLDELAVETGVHPVTISKYFSLYFSCTLGDYLRQLKVRRALALIQNTSLSLTEIAYECGFYDQIHFTRTFKQYTGLLPKVYKRL